MMAGADQPSFLPYGRHWLDEDDIAAVVEVLRSDWLTGGPKVAAFEKEVAAVVGARYAAALCNGTAGLHAALHARGIGPGDEVIVPAITFAATANAVLYQGGTPVFADIQPETLLIDSDQVRAKITGRTKAVICVDYAGQPCDYDALQPLCSENDLTLVADACHALGAQYQGKPVGSLADLTVFSFHPVKHLTTGEGGMVVTGSLAWAEHIKRFRNHGIATDHRQRQEAGTWYYEMLDLGFNYRITDIQCALGLSQLRKQASWLAHRRQIATFYDQALSGLAGVEPLAVKPEVGHAYHLYVVRLERGISRQEVYSRLREQGIGVNVHYLPVHLHPFYRQRLGTGPGDCPQAEKAYERILSLPMHQGLTIEQAARVVAALQQALQGI